jgi:hypothetical protein
LERALKGIWGDEAVGVFELAPLRRVDVVAAAEERAIDPKAFIEELYDANVVPFAIKPLTLNLLLGLFQRDGRLPRSIAELYTLGCRKLCEEQNPSRRDSRNFGRLNPDQRLRLAGRLAAVTMFANRYAIWTGTETDLFPEGDVSLSKLSSGQEEGDFQAFLADESNLREVLDTGLFSARGPARMGWAHQSYAEFLAALYLTAKGTPSRNVLKLLVHPSGGLIPQLSTVAAWTASLNKEIRKGLIAQEPLALFRGDLVNWAAEDLADLTESLLIAHDRQRIHDFVPGIANAYARLAHPGLAVQLQTYINDKTKSVQARRTACSIAEACELKGLQPELLGLALDVSEDPSLRARAVSALGKCGDDSIAGDLLLLAKGELGPDPTNDLKGQALQFLWSRHITATELFSMLTPPNDGYFGAYAMFLTQTLPETLSTADLSPALRWATVFIKASSVHDHDFHRKSLSDIILVQAWGEFGRPDLTQLFVKHVFSRLKDGGDLFKGTDTRRQEAFSEELESNVAKRRAFLVAAGKAGFENLETFGLLRSGFLKDSDFGWLLSISPNGAAPITGVDGETLCNMIQSTYDWKNAAQFEALYAIATQWERLRQRYAGLLDGLLLESADVKQQIENHRLMEQLDRRRRPLLEPPPAERVKDCLTRFEAGQLEAWWHLNCELTLSPQSTHYGADHNFIITAMPGWRAADQEIRNRIIAAAESYLKNAEPLVSEWLGTNEYKRSDYAAYRALVLLRETRRAAYDGFGPDLWRKWAPLIAAVDRLTGAEEADLHDSIASEALSAAPTEFAETVQKLIQAERAKTPKNPDQTQQLMPFLILRRLAKCWGSTAIKNVAFDELRNPENSPAQFQALTEPLLEAGFDLARGYAISILADARPERRDYLLAAAFGLANFCATHAWPEIWKLALDREDFGEELFLRLADRGRFQAAFHASLPEPALGDLYLWLERKFPHSGDPNTLTGTAHYVGPREIVAELRDGVLRRLVELGTDAALKTLRVIISECPDLTWLPLELSRAEQIMRMKSWAPLTPAQVLSLATSRRGRLVQSPEDLCDTLIEALQKYENELHGEQTPVQFLWAKQTKGMLTPVDENALSDHVKAFLKRELADSGIVLNREVEVGRVPGAPVGSRTDIKIDAVRHGENGDAYDVIVAVIETKGCWNAELFTAIQTQLRDDYLKRLGAPLGVYLVGWFDKAKWDASDSRRKRAPSLDLAEARHLLEEKAAELSKGYIIRAVVLDCHAH